MQYNIVFELQELDAVIKMIQEWPYRMAAPILETIKKQVEFQNIPIWNMEESKEKDLSDKQE